MIQRIVTGLLLAIPRLCSPLFVPTTGRQQASISGLAHETRDEISSSIRHSLSCGSNTPVTSGFDVADRLSGQ